MSTPLPDFRPGTKIYGQNAAGVRGPGWVYADGAAAGQSNILIINEASGATVVVANAAYIAEDTAFAAATAQFKLNYVTP